MVDGEVNKNSYSRGARAVYRRIAEGLPTRGGGYTAGARTVYPSCVGGVRGANDVIS